jgi:hypothetical protein
MAGIYVRVSFTVVTKPWRENINNKIYQLIKQNQSVMCNRKLMVLAANINECLNSN